MYEVIIWFQPPNTLYCPLAVFVFNAEIGYLPSLCEKVIFAEKVIFPLFAETEGDVETACGVCKHTVDLQCFLIPLRKDLARRWQSNPDLSITSLNPNNCIIADSCPL